MGIVLLGGKGQWLDEDASSGVFVALLTDNGAPASVLPPAPPHLAVTFMLASAARASYVAIRADSNSELRAVRGCWNQVVFSRAEDVRLGPREGVEGLVDAYTAGPFPFLWLEVGPEGRGGGEDARVLLSL
jgi:hypothetical protein